MFHVKLSSIYQIISREIFSILNYHVSHKLSSIFQIISREIFSIFNHQFHVKLSSIYQIISREIFSILNYHVSRKLSSIYQIISREIFFYPKFLYFTLNFLLFTDYFSKKIIILNYNNP